MKVYRKARGAAARLVGATDRRLSAMRHQRIRPKLLIKDDGPGGPLLVVVSDHDDFSRYLIEILRAEGLNCFRVVLLTRLAPEVLKDHKAVLLGCMPLSSQNAELLTGWVERGGKLLAMRPDRLLASLFGIEPVGSTLVEGYLQVDVTRSPGTGITDRIMQFHGEADCYRVLDATVVAELFTNSTSPSNFPGVITRAVGEAGGQAAAFTYDLARSVVYTRQGNPAWVGQNRDGDLLNRSDDLFFGAAEGDVQSDWVDPELLDVPQADEQQRLMVNLLQYLCADETVLPRFWYLPHRHVAAIVMTGDDHALNGTAERFHDYSSLDSPDASGDDWGQVRGTSYVYAHSPMTDAEAKALEQQGFEISLHVTTKGTEYDLGSLSRTYRKQLKLFRSRYPSVQPPSTHRTHCVVWSDWSTQAEVERAYGIRLDTNYYFYPAPWVDGRIGLFTGSGFPMRFASTKGEVIDCYQAATQLTDETNQVFPETISVALDQALAYQGRATVLTANMHTDLGASSGSDAIVAEARRRGVPVISARQLLAWLDSRIASSVSGIELNGDVLRFSITTPGDISGLSTLLPLPKCFNSVSSVTCDGEVVSFSFEELWGSIHVGFSARSGSYELHCSTEPAVVKVGYQPVHQTGDVLIIDDFLGGTHECTTLSSVRGGSVILSPGILLDLEIGTPSTEWEAVSESATMSAESITAGSSLEAEVIFSGSPGQYVGLTKGADLETSIVFAIDSSGTLTAVNSSAGSRLVTPIPGTWYDQPHRFRIDWDAGLTLFAVDGRTIAEHRMQLRESLRPIIGGPVGTQVVKVPWLRTSDFPLSGTFISKVIDSGMTSTWGHATISSPALTMTGAKLAVRAGDAQQPDDSWSEWVWPGASGKPLGITGRYLQYQVKLLTASFRWTPEVTGVSIERLP